MKPFTIHKIREIAQQLDCGNKVFVHKTTRELLSLPDSDSFLDIDMEPWNRELELLDNNYDDYYPVEKWSSSESFRLMENFIKNLSDNWKLRGELTEALNSKKPFREFKHVIDNSGPYRQLWFDFKNKGQQEFVAQQLNGLNTTTD